MNVLSFLLLSVRHPGSGEDEVPELRLVVLGAELVAEHPHRAVRVGVDAGAGLGLVDTLQRSSWSRGISVSTRSLMLAHLASPRPRTCRRAASGVLTRPRCDTHRSPNIGKHYQTQTQIFTLTDLARHLASCGGRRCARRGDDIRY